ncbi:chorismate-binding protein [Flavobacteriaceae bacterium F89]|uniref:Chorismate-binding protein n=1 Tax=Cerina litoralis TaxID=2874477 RepID=A0AAE3EUF1_9FLAO|nr:chorismate-binding protein [Cerina litoralis]MCG2461292.1 chorismate-binding protein [Cerina litoralis]
METHLLQNLPFAVYRKPNEDKVRAILQNDTTLHHCVDFSEKGFVFAPFNAASSPILLQPESVLEEDYLPGKVSNANVENLSPLGENGKEIHMDLVIRGIKEIEKGNLKKVVLSRKLEVKCDKLPMDLFRELLGRYPTAFCYLWYHPKVGMWLGASPELLLSVRNKQLYTSSIAGTQVFNGEENPIWGKKELEEQDMVTHYITEALENKVTDVRVSGTKSVRAGNLWHLGTNISGRIKDMALSPIIKALHPTPAVCGLPQKLSQKFILEHENYDREFYTGFLGELNRKEQVGRSDNPRNQENAAYKLVRNTTQLFVNLRCMQIDGNTATLYVGGGITRASDPEKEWQETVEKSGTLLKVIFD